MNYLEFKNWKNSHSAEMRNLDLASAEDIFIYTKFIAFNPLNFENKQILFAESLEETLGYIRHIFLYDILNDIADDMNYDFESLNSEQQNDAAIILSYWYKAGKISIENENCKELREFCEDFNSIFSKRNSTAYEIKFLNGADELQKFLIEEFSKSSNFEKEDLLKICSKNSFKSIELMKFVSKLL